MFDNLYFIFTVKNGNEPVKIETSLIKISHKKRKDGCPWTIVNCFIILCKHIKLNY